MFTLLCNAGVAFKRKRYLFSIGTIDYLRHVIRSQILEETSHMTNAICGLQHPTNLTELCSFLGLCNIFLLFVPNLARMAVLLNAKLQKDKPKIFGPFNNEELKPKNLLKESLKAPPILTLTSFTGHIILDTDACDVQVESVLLQAQHDNTTRSNGHWSRSYTSADWK